MSGVAGSWVQARTSFDGEAGAEEKHDAWHHGADEGCQVLRPERKLDVCPVEQRQVTLICASSLRVSKQPTTLQAVNYPILSTLPTRNSTLPARKRCELPNYTDEVRTGEGQDPRDAYYPTKRV